jgi:UDP-N-acetyl-2-amino-2-deoxyglucuronate dehydrogenase
MKFAVVGAGAIGDLHAQTMADLPAAEVGVVVDVRLERAQALAERHQALALTDLSEALFMPDIDAVAICTPSGQHADMVVAALKAGKHVVVEKPLDISLEAAHRVAAAERDSDRRVTVISQHRSTPRAGWSTARCPRAGSARSAPASRPSRGGAARRITTRQGGAAPGLSMEAEP